MLLHGPALWVHGHIHHASDDIVDATRVVCNPKGYQAEDWEEEAGRIEYPLIEV